MVQRPLRGPAQRRGQDADRRHPLVVDGLLHEHAEYEQAENRAVGVRRQGIDRRDGVLVAQIVEGDDYQAHERRHGHMDSLAGAGEPVLVLLLVGLKDVDGEGRRQRSQSGAGGGVGRRDKAQDEEDADDYGHLAVEGHHAEEFVALLGARQALAVHIDNQQRAEHQEQGDDEELNDTADNHVLLALSRILAGQVALHHVLVEAVGGDGHEHTGEELLPEVGRLHGVVEEEHLRLVVVPDAAGHLAEVEAQVGGHEVDAQNHGHDQAETLQCVGPDEGLHAALDRIEPDERDGDDYIEDERNMQRSEHKQLQNRADDEETHGGAEHLRDKEEPRAGAVGRAPEALLQVTVDGDEILLIEQRHQHESYHEVAYDKAQNHLQVGVALGGDHARHRDESYAGNRRADHGEGHQRPGSLALAGKERGIVAPARGEVRHEHQQAEIADDGQDNYQCFQFLRHLNGVLEIVEMNF